MNPDIAKLHELYRLKEIERRGRVGNRQESTAEHTFSTMVLAAYFLPKITPKLDEGKVYRMLLMHDWVEVHAGDTYIFDEASKKTQEERERDAHLRLVRELPEALAQEYKRFYEEYEKHMTREARFARALETIDPMMHSLMRKEDWRRNNFEEQRLRAKKEPVLREFPVLLEFFSELVAWMREQGYFSD